MFIKQMLFLETFFNVKHTKILYYNGILMENLIQ